MTSLAVVASLVLSAATAALPSSMVPTPTSTAKPTVPTSSSSQVVASPPPFIDILGPIALSNATFTCAPAQVAFGGGLGGPYTVQVGAYSPVSSGALSYLVTLGQYEQSGTLHWDPNKAVGNLTVGDGIKFIIKDAAGEVATSVVERLESILAVDGVCTKTFDDAWSLVKTLALVLGITFGSFILLYCVAQPAPQAPPPAAGPIANPGRGTGPHAQPQIAPSISLEETFQQKVDLQPPAYIQEEVANAV